MLMRMHAADDLDASERCFRVTLSSFSSSSISATVLVVHPLSSPIQPSVAEGIESIQEWGMNFVGLHQMPPLSAIVIADEM